MAHIVVLEDDYTLLELYKDVLDAGGYDVFGATRLQEIIEYVAENEADVIVADLRLSTTPARETIQALATIHQQTQIAVLLVSAQMMIYEKTCREAGFEHLLTKPFQNHVLLAKIAEILGE
ncbi:MAG: response regulator [Chloroflexota bacterium]